MQGFATQPNGEPVLNPSWQNLSKSKAGGWGINGPGVSAEWSQGGESEWNSAAASADESAAQLHQQIEIPRAGSYRLWVRYADWANQTENFAIRIGQGNRPTVHHEFGLRDRIDPHDEISMYWGWTFTWDSVEVKLEKGPAQLSIEIEKIAGARRHVDCVLLTNDLHYIPDGRSKPDFAAMRYLRDWSQTRTPLASLLNQSSAMPSSPWQRSNIAGRDFFMPWNIAPEFWKLYDQPAAKRPVFPFNAEPIEEYVKKYKGARDVPIFSSKLVVPVIYVNNLPEYLKEGSSFLRYLRETKAPFAVLINYGSAQMSETDGQAAWKLLTGELSDQFLGWISGESIGYVWDKAPAELRISPAMSRPEMLDAYRDFYTKASAKKWAAIFHTDTGAMWDKLIPAQATSSTSFSHALASWGVKLLGVETAAVQPMFGMRIAFTRGAVRQFGNGNFLYYQAPNFGDTATTFTKQQNFAGPDNFFHSRYGATMGPSLSWYRKSYYLYYMSGASAIYLEQGFDQFFKPGPGNHEFQLNPLGRITNEFMKFAEKHPDRGEPYTPIAFLLDAAHGWDMTDYPQWPFGVSQINRSDRALRELFGVAYYPGLVVEGEPASGDRQAFVSGIFGDIFDVLVAPGQAKSKSQNNQLPLHAYRAIVVGGHISWSAPSIERLTSYVKNGGTLVLNSAQIAGLPPDLIGVRLRGRTSEDNFATCVSRGEAQQNLAGQLFRYDQVELSGAQPLINSSTGAPLVTLNRVGRGTVVFAAIPDLLGEDERMTPFSAHMLAHVFADATPVRVRGDVEYLINRSKTSWIVTLFNNNGVIKPQQGLAQVDRSASVIAEISLPSSASRTAFEWIQDKSLKVRSQNGETVVAVEIPPGGVSIVEFPSP